MKIITFRRKEIRTMAEIKKYEDTPDFVSKRNERLMNFFQHNGFGVQEIRIIGDENNPAVLYKDEHVLNCHVHNFELRFTDAPFNGKLIKKYKLMADVSEVRSELIQLIQDYPARKVYKIYLESNGSNLVYLCGWNHLNVKERLGRYPVFGLYKPKVYFTIEKANELKDELAAEGYRCQII
jgi:hypothetical protein